MVSFYFYFVLFAINIIICNGANILYISLTPSKSHYIWDRSLAFELKENNHKVTLVSHFPEKCEENFTTIEFEGTLENLHNMKSFDISSIKSEQSFYDVKHIFTLLTVFCKLNTENKEFNHLLSVIDNGPKFDLLIIDLLCSQCLLPIIDKLKVPVIGTSQFGLMPFFSYFLGSDVNSAHIPVYKLPYSDEMTFSQKIYNYFYGLLMLYWRQYVFMPEQWKIAKNAFGENITTYQEAENKINLVLANYNPVLDYPQAIPPTIIPVGGLHAQRHDILSNDLQQIMDSSKHGVIMFSLGTNILSTDLNCPVKEQLIKAFSKLNQTIIWKHENPIEGIPIPNNIIIRRWLPQNTLLSHPNMKLFISHGGALSTQEAMIHAVPLFIVPMFADQFVNAEKIVHRKLGVRLHFHDFIAEKIIDNVNEAIYNPIYKTNMKQISRRYRDQHIDPLSKAISWVEYILENGDTEYLHVAGRKISWFSTLHFDTWICIFTSIFCSIYTKKLLNR